MAKATRRKPAIKLPSSYEILFFPDDSIEEGTLTCLLSEGYERRIHPFRFVLVTEKRRDRRLNSWGFDGAYVAPLVKVRYHQLLDMWKELPGTSRARSYSPEEEQDRLNFLEEAIERRANFISQIGQFMSIAGEEARTGVGMGALYPLGSSA